MNDQNPLDFIAQNALVSEESFEGHTLRTVFRENEYWFVAKDVADALGYVEPSKAINKFCKGVAQHYPLQTKGGIQEMRIINKPDLYRLVLKSEAKGAERFQDWIVEDLLPTLEREGSYHMALKDVPKRLFTLDEIDTLCDKYLPPLPYQEPEQYDTDSDDWRFIVYNRIDIRTPYQKREDERRLFKTQLKEISGEYMELRELYALFEANVKAAGRIIDGGEMSTAEKLVETYKAFRQRVKQTVFDLGFGPEDIPDETMAAINYERCFAEQFRKTWKAYIGDTRKDGGVTAEYGPHIWLHRIK